jgi:hypothetical protein
MEASLTGGAGDNFFDIGAWTGTMLKATIDGGAGMDTVEATTDTDFTAANALLKLVGSGDATLLNIENGVFRGGKKANKFNMSDWTLSGRVDAGPQNAKIIDTIISNVAGSTSLTNDLLSRAGCADLALLGLKTAELTGSSGDDVFDCYRESLSKNFRYRNIGASKSHIKIAPQTSQDSTEPREVTNWWRHI